MPCYDFICPQGHKDEDVFITRQQLTDVRVCVQCQQPMKREFPRSLHTRVGTSVDSKDSGSVIREKNEKLKAMFAGYGHEQESIREKVTRYAQEKVEKAGM